MSRSSSPVERFAVILPAAGLSTRFKKQQNKLLANLAGLPVIAHTVAAFLCRRDVRQIIIPTRNEEMLRPAIAVNGRLAPRIKFCAGGETRAHTVQNALIAVDSSIEWVAIHDAARPLVSQELIDRTFRAAREYGAAAPALPVHLTIKETNSPLPAKVGRTIPRHSLYTIQTPQIMRRESLVRAIETCTLNFDQVTDDLQFLELGGWETWLVEGNEQNLKITTAMDLQLAELILQDRPS